MDNCTAVDIMLNYTNRAAQHAMKYVGKAEMMMMIDQEENQTTGAVVAFKRNDN